MQAEKLKDKSKSKKNYHSSLFRRYFAGTAAVILVSILVIGFVFMLLVSFYWTNEKQVLLSETTEAVALNTEQVLTSDYMGQSGRGSVIVVCNNLRQISSAVDADIFICNTRGEVVYCKELLRDDMEIFTGSCMVHSQYRIPKEIMKDALKAHCSDTGDLGGCLSNQSFVVSSPIIVNGKTIAVVFATQTMADGLAPYILAIFRLFAYIALAAFALDAIAVYFLTEQMTRPLREMAKAAEQYAKGDFAPRVSLKKVKDFEMLELINSFNSMAQALSSLESSRRSFVSNVSHELKTPMTSIAGFIDGILDGTIDRDNQSRYLQLVSDEVKRLSRLVTGMLNISKIESGEMDLNPVSFNIFDMIATTLISFDQVLESKDIEVRGLEDSEQFDILADRDMINQVIYNLIDNAVKFTPEYGRITISVSKDPEKAIIHIRNTGKGIRPEEIEKIFERFYKVDKSRSYDVKSSGLGLFLCRTIVDLHGGTIKASSVPDEYTDFALTLPLNLYNYGG